MKLFGQFALDEENGCLWRGTERVALPPKPLAVLAYLANHPGQLVTHDALLDTLWPDVFVQPQVLRTYILDLRKILGDVAAESRYIQTVPKRGYCFIATVRDGGAKDQVKPEPCPPCTLTGRAEEMRQLEAFCAQARQGRRQAIFVTGDAGIGKTALIESFCQSQGESVRATGQCMEGLQYCEELYPVLEIVEQLRSGPAAQAATAALGQLAPGWLPAAGETASADATRRAPAPRTLQELSRAIESMAEDQLVILVIEDLQWADESTLRLVAMLAQRKLPAQLLIIATLRRGYSASVSSLSALQRSLLLHQAAEELALGPLRRDEIRTLLAQRWATTEPQAHAVDFVLQHGEGNPLFIGLLADHLASGGFLRDDQKGPLLLTDVGVPDGTRRLIELELDQLDAGEQQLLESASLPGIACPAWAIAAALELEIVEAEEQCDAIARRYGFLHRAGRDELPDGGSCAFYVLAHSLAREVLYDRQSHARRAARHARIAEWMRTTFRHRERHVAREIAVHYEAAERWPQAIGMLRLAAEQATDTGAHAEAAALVMHAGQLCEFLAEPDRARVRRSLALHTESTGVIRS